MRYVPAMAPVLFPPPPPPGSPAPSARGGFPRRCFGPGPRFRRVRSSRGSRGPPCGGVLPPSVRFVCPGCSGVRFPRVGWVLGGFLGGWRGGGGGFWACSGGVGWGFSAGGGGGLGLVGGGCLGRRFSGVSSPISRLFFPPPFSFPSPYGRGPLCPPPFFPPPLFDGFLPGCPCLPLPFARGRGAFFFFSSRSPRLSGGVWGLPLGAPSASRSGGGSCLLQLGPSAPVEGGVAAESFSSTNTTWVGVSPMLWPACCCAGSQLVVPAGMSTSRSTSPE